MHLALLYFLFSCSNESINEPEEGGGILSLSNKEIKVLTLETEGYSIRGRDEVENKALDAINKISLQQVRNKSIGARKVKNMKALKNKEFVNGLMRTSSGSNNNYEISDTLACIVNFENNEGFAIIATDKRIDDYVLAFCEKGNIEDNEILSSGLSIFLEHAENYVLNTITEYELEKDSILNELNKKNISPSLARNGINTFHYVGNVFSEVTVVYKDKVTTKVSPRVSVNWGQDAPYNNHLNKMATGCTPTAVAQIMSYWKHPVKIDGVSYDWDLINRSIVSIHHNTGNPTALNQVASLMKVLGTKMGTKYGETSSTNDGKAQDVLRSFGYSVEEKGYNYGAIRNNLVFKHIPTLISGKINNSGSLKGHTFIIDGILGLETKKSILVMRKNPIGGDRPPLEILGRETQIQTDSYHHINWGWNGSQNGYFNAYVFNANNSPLYRTGYNSNLRSGESKNYQYRVKAITPSL